MTPTREVLARNLRDARENRGVSQQAAADHLGLSRTLVAQIELGNRTVSADELAALAKLYGLAVVDLAADDAPNDNELLVVLFDIAPELLEPAVKARLAELVALCREAMTLEQTLEWPPRGSAPHYVMRAPRTAAEAIRQGEDVAEQERRRLGLGSTPAGDIAALLEASGVRSAGADLPDNVTGVCLQQESVGAVILCNRRHARARRRFALVHEYAHVLIDRERTAMVTKRSNASDLVEKRANAFATAFLLPQSGVAQVLWTMDKGHGSRREHIAFDVANEAAITAKMRSAPGSQAVTYQDVARVADRFGTSYPAAVYRLLAIAALSELEAKRLLTDQRLDAARVHHQILNPVSCDLLGGTAEPDELWELKADIVRLSIEAHRRRLVTEGQLITTGKRLHLSGLTPEMLLELAAAAW